jgi:hypothetical protein
MLLDWTLPVKVPRMEGSERLQIPLPALGVQPISPPARAPISEVSSPKSTKAIAA